MLVDENLDHGLRSPHVLGGSPVTIHLIVDDVDAWVTRAAAAGATVTMPVADMFWVTATASWRTPSVTSGPSPRRSAR